MSDLLDVQKSLRWETRLYLQSVIVTFHGHSQFLANIVFFRHDKILLLAKKEQVVQGNIFKLK